MQQSPRRSARQHAQALGLSRTSFTRILHDLNFHPHKIAVVQMLKPQDITRRILFCNTMKKILDDDPDIQLFMSDEAHFHLNGEVNKPNCRYWAQNNPSELHQQPLHSEKVTAWAAVKTAVIGLRTIPASCINNRCTLKRLQRGLQCQNHVSLDPISSKKMEEQSP
ncbi:uncharacterized protein LOC113470619 [Diaphorina citri]|uniref:Uncharacterized protein LOC113470619 n=1 Tax=Diaphorina citri TaxID=121845 RepID=A0A3Q0J948_DIACI|nr:uncharacterized protein LOC113470619 [Diaphorina citri]